MARRKFHGAAIAPAVVHYDACQDPTRDHQWQPQFSLAGSENHFSVKSDATREVAARPQSTDCQLDRVWPLFKTWTLHFVLAALVTSYLTFSRLFLPAATFQPPPAIRISGSHPSNSQTLTPHNRSHDSLLQPGSLTIWFKPQSNGFTDEF
jgi:hypothetical protein